MGLFKSKASIAETGADRGRLPRYSSGWVELAKHLKGAESLRLLDIGPTSAGNINFVTNLGHSIYMANLVEEAVKPDWLRDLSVEDDPRKPAYDVDKFLKHHLDFAGRHFDVVTLWDTLDYLPEGLVQPVIDRIHEVMDPGGKLLAFFHSKLTGDDTAFTRYHLTDRDQVDLQRVGGHEVRQISTNRQVETIFREFSTYKFFLAKDALREVIVTR